MGHANDLLRLLAAEDTDPFVKSLAEKALELQRRYHKHSTPFLIGTCGEWTFKVYEAYDTVTRVYIVRQVGDLRYSITKDFTLSYAHRAFPEMSASDWEWWDADDGYEDVMTDGDWYEIKFDFLPE